MTTINPCYIVFENLECLTAYSYRKMKRFYDYLSVYKNTKIGLEKQLSHQSLLAFLDYLNLPACIFKYAMTGGVVIITCHCS